MPPNRISAAMHAAPFIGGVLSQACSGASDTLAVAKAVPPVSKPPLAFIVSCLPPAFGPNRTV
eukprot:scaffold100362_cov23-Prasinocladus_malaysianus.AAC.1